METLEELTKKELKNLRSNVHKYIEGALLSIIGLEKKYNNDYEIDHCNNRNSLLISTFERMAREEASNIAKDYKPKKQELEMYREAFSEEMSRQMKYAMNEIAKQRAKEEAEKIVSKIKLNVNKILKEQGLKVDDLQF